MLRRMLSWIILRRSSALNSLSVPSSPEIDPTLGFSITRNSRSSLSLVRWSDMPAVALAKLANFEPIFDFGSRFFFGRFWFWCFLVRRFFELRWLAFFVRGAGLASSFSGSGLSATSSTAGAASSGSSTGSSFICSAASAASSSRRFASSSLRRLASVFRRRISSSALRRAISSADSRCFASSASRSSACLALRHGALLRRGDGPRPLRAYGVLRQLWHPVWLVRLLWLLLPCGGGFRPLFSQRVSACGVQGIHRR